MNAVIIMQVKKYSTESFLIYWSINQKKVNAEFSVKRLTWCRQKCKLYRPLWRRLAGVFRRAIFREALSASKRWCPDQTCRGRCSAWTQPHYNPRICTFYRCGQLKTIVGTTLISEWRLKPSDHWSNQEMFIVTYTIIY